MNDETHILREIADLFRAIEERPLTGGMKVPDRALFDLEQVREKALSRRKAPRHLSFVTRHSGFLRIAAVLALLAAITWLLIPSTSLTARVVITSPGDVISETQPHIARTSRDAPGQKHDVWILPAEGDHLTALALFLTKSVTSPNSSPARELLPLACNPASTTAFLCA